jgi:ribosome small subunit-dependent GTPase A
MILGTAGHIDHGKTALVRALTGVDTDRLPEEKRRGITIDLGFAPLRLPNGGVIGVVDVPGHEAFVRTMLAGATGIDVALIVIAADEGPMPQTREHLAILQLLGVRHAVVALTKADLVDRETLDVAEEETRERLAGTVLAGSEIVRVSAVTGEGIEELERLLRPGRTAVLLGASGAGKSTLINHLLGAERLRTAEVREDGKGRHTTTHRELVRLRGGALLIDTPGMRELQLWDADAGLGAAFADIYELSAGCRFRDCRHDTEPGCAVHAAVDEGRLPAERLEHWRKLERELAWLARRQDELATAADKARAKAAERLGRARLKEKGR